MPAKARSFTDCITAGAWRGQPLQLPDSPHVRPSKQRVRQAAMNLLGARLHWPDCVVADLCCGSGALGLEAASRGAKQVWLVDADPRTAQGNVRALQARHGDVPVQVAKADVLAWQPPARLDVVLADPPYASDLAQLLLARRETLGRPGCWWLLETGCDSQLNWTGFADTGRRAYGQSVLWWGGQL